MRKRITDSEGLAYSGAVITGNSGRSRLIVLAVVSLMLIALIVVLYVRGLKGTSSAAAEHLEAKTAPCYSDSDCPDGTFCSGRRLCVPLAALPPLAPPLLPLPEIVTSAAVGVGETIGRVVDRVLGRGRGGEGANVQQVSSDQKGQSP